MTPDLQKLRRFALAIALVLITYSLAGVELQIDSEIRPFGLPFKIARPELLPIGLMVASLYALLLFWYYGVMRVATPWGARLYWRRKRGKLNPSKEHSGLTRSDVRRQTEQVSSIFPRVFRWRADLTYLPLSDAFAADRPVLAEIIIPWPVRIASRLDEVNYSAPIWLNGIALILATWRLV